MNPEPTKRMGFSQRSVLTVGIGGAVLLVLAALFGQQNIGQFYGAYLTAYLFWLGLALGCLALAMIHYLTGGRWGDPTQRFLEAGYAILPAMVLLFVPVILGIKKLYPWAQPEKIDASKTLQSKLAYLNAPGFLLRAAVVFLVWSALSLTLRRWSLKQDSTANLEWLKKIRKLSGVGIVAYVMTTTFAYIDWAMSLESDWYSTMFPIIICISQILMALTFITILLVKFKAAVAFSPFDLPVAFYQLGNLLLAFVVFWAYVMFSQFLIIWAGNLPHEIVWYKHRLSGGWMGLIYGLLIFHFLLPFFILLSRAAKKAPRSLAVVAALILCAHIAAEYWIIKPSLDVTLRVIGITDLLCFLGMGALWLSLFFVFLNRVPLVARNDPRMIKKEVTYAQ